MTASAIDPAKLDKLAQLAVTVGLGLREGQDLFLTSPNSALPLARKIAEYAYKAGAGLVTTIFSDEQMTLARYRHGHDLSFDRAPGWLYEGVAKAFDENTARLAISGDNPMLLGDEDPEKVGRANRANSKAYRPALSKIVGHEINWSIVPYPGASWAKTVFPDDAEEVAVHKLAEAIFAATRVNSDDPVAAWDAHNKALHQRCEWLTGQNFAALKYSGPGTDLTLGLADGHAWKGGGGVARNGIRCNANIPTEEVFTTPHRLRVEGVVSATKPLSYNGTLIADIQMTFEAGRIVEVKATRGRDVLEKAMDSDEGGRRIGEVALVPHSSPISQSGILFYNTLFDENAASHIALGQCYSDCFIGGETITPEEVERRGGNKSVIHIDWMIGSDRIDIDGIGQDGSITPVMRKGEWA
ncbi:aminopeptidase [Devosia sp. 66-22]|uniref:aminopeptidase n=1 Tax=Devosia sp. 66-22 TaxID=1895753 RepID=UPI000926B8E2|nr:aminopeptidase [Devosia sp. 66-22]OJX55609.1 MAG: aminopeptidase [Devosia sp. 66-22]